MTEAEPCTGEDDDGVVNGEHAWKFNSGDPVCWKCDTYMHASPQRRVFPATVNEDGTVTVHLDNR